MQASRGKIGIWILAAMLCIVAPPVRAQGRASRALRSADVTRSAAGWELELHFEFPIRYLRHTPQQPGRLLRIQVQRLDIGGDTGAPSPFRETLPIPRDEPIPLQEIAYDGSILSQPFVEIQFTQTLSFEIREGRDSRSLRIRAEVPTKAPSAAGDADDSRAGRLIARARRSIRDGELDLAIALLTRVLELPESEVSVETRMDARELVALTYERRGQLAHAQAEYEGYLEDYPEGPAATRVRQRLDALITASDAPSQKPLRAAREPLSAEDESEIRRDLYGSTTARYFRVDSLLDDSDRDFLASDVLFDLDLTGRLDADQWALRSDFTGTYDFDVADEGRTDDLRISRLSIQAEDKVHRLEAIVGRQRRSDSGILGRFDGVRLAAGLGDHFSISAVAGLPVQSSSDSVPNTDTVMAGGAVDFRNLWIEGLQGQIFAVGHHAASTTARAAVGGELRYANDKTYSFLYLDYDVSFNSLNTFMFSSTYRPTTDTDYRLLLERRNSPVLTLAAALQGTNFDDLDDLADQLSDDELRDLAEDRTATTWVGTLGATHRPTDLLQVSGDLSVSYISGTNSSPAIGPIPAIEGTDASGPNFAASVQLLRSDFLIENAVGSVTVRYFEGDNFRSLLTNAYSRFTIVQNLRILPRLRWEWRDSELEGSQSVLRPSAEIDWRFNAFVFNVESGILWTEPILGGDAFREVSYFVEASVRWEF